MRKIIIPFVCFLAALTTLYLNFLVPSEEYIIESNTEFVIGSWHTSYNYGGMHFDLDIDFKPDNTFHQSGTMIMPSTLDVKCKISSKGTFSINDEYYKYESGGTDIECDDRAISRAFEATYKNLQSVGTSEILSINKDLKTMVMEHEEIGKVTYQKEAP